LAFWQANDAIKQLARRRWNGRFTEVALYRYVNHVFLRSGDDALPIEWCDLTGVKAETGEQLYHNSFITNHHVTAETVAEIARAGRARWKSKNDNNNVRKTKGYHVEHNCGHGKKSLSAFLLSRNLLAFLFHTVLQWCDDK
jgi:hypothetical protein